MTSNSLRPLRFIFTFLLFIAAFKLEAQSDSKIGVGGRQVRGTPQSWAIACPSPSLNLSTVFQKSREEVLKSFNGWSLKFSVPDLDVEYKVELKPDGSPVVVEIKTPKAGGSSRSELTSAESQDLMVSMLKSIHPVEIPVDSGGRFTADPLAEKSRKSLSLIEKANLGVCREDSGKFLWRGKRVEEAVRADYRASVSVTKPGEKPVDYDLGGSVGFSLLNRSKAIEAMGLDASDKEVCLFYTDPSSPQAKIELLARDVPEDSDILKPSLNAFRQMLTHLKSLNAATTSAPAQASPVLGTAQSILRSQSIETLSKEQPLNGEFSVSFVVQAAGKTLTDKDVIAHTQIQLLEVSEVVTNRQGEVSDAKLTSIELLEPMVIRDQSKPETYEFVVRPKKPLKPNQLYLLVSPEKVSFEDAAKVDYKLRYFRTVKN